MVGGGKPWQEIRRRKAEEASGSSKATRRKEDPRQTTFFVANLPNGTKAMELETCFMDFGKMWKTNGEMERSLASINLINARLMVNLAKFDRDGMPSSRVKANPPQQTYARPPHQYQEPNGSIRGKGNYTYRDALIRNQYSSLEVSVPEDADYDVVQCFVKVYSVAKQVFSDEEHKGSPATSEGERSDMGNDVQSFVHGVGNSHGMGNANKSDSLVAQDNPSSPSVAEVAQRINALAGPGSRKRPRLEHPMRDPFDIDRFIGGVPIPPIPTPNPLRSNNTGSLSWPKFAYEQCASGRKWGIYPRFMRAWGCG
ncbi:hypothetical protein L1987_82553 [Smallanthus sonchifolius]|uniref:Uncharacterized protein n=1 Tax=Smallanthus sonchifolius TaxID=185202 RepID=A0ACB8YAV0_9ASTR|nr:hypothetical protein L1987_82553 [Smallanthus sonchifolius]